VTFNLRNKLSAVLHFQINCTKLCSKDLKINTKKGTSIPELLRKCGPRLHWTTA